MRAPGRGDAVPPIRALVYSQQARRADAPPVGAWKYESKVGRAEACAQAAGGCGHGGGAEIARKMLEK